MYNLEDTICAQSTPQGRGGLHVIRVSGLKSLEYVKTLFTGFPKVVQPNYVYYGNIKDPHSKKTIDEAMVTFFAKGRSFTAEETVEISCHGNPVIVREIINLLLSCGCRIADRGEFTYRAYKNGRINLAQAESVLMLIEANSPAFLDKALRQLDGQFTESLLKIEDKLIWVVSRLEAMLDFATEDIEIEKQEVILKKLNDAISFLNPLVKNFDNRNLIDKGIKTLILGPPNVGKSSLLNEFLGRKRAIVSEIAGTTRDFVSETTLINDKTFEMIDTAGLRATDNLIESEGIQMAKELVDTSDLVLILLDPDHYQHVDHYIELTKDRKAIILINKSDLLSSDNMLKVKNFLSHIAIPTHFISIYNKEGLEAVFNNMSSIFDLKEQESSLEVISVRQKNLLDAVLSDLSEGYRVFSEGISEEFVLSHLNSALKNLLQIRFIEDEEVVRDKIFKDFCLGK